MLQIHHLRNATLVIETEKDVILVEPMLGKKGTLPTFTFFRFKAQKNPIVELPDNSQAILNKVTHCLITHAHPDHLDTAAERFLIKNNIPVTCSIKDEKLFKKKGLDVVQTIDYWKKSNFLGGTIEGIPAKHGYGFISKPMGNVMGFYIELPNQKSIYLSSDTIYTPSVDKVLKEYKPAISVIACGSAQLDIFQPLLMKMKDIVKFVQNSDGIVIANHLEAVNHCPTTRIGLQKELEKNGLSYKVHIPNDGDVIIL
ncbi:MBL fold metallo-hydrolase [Bernardetia sp. MNP-M8]|uniref:MBL fold metallo-hydrolase n=1 Tax=Bernardetia sp. MNP-M8 TaxID=3127470 RepID=UPI0030D577A9